MVLITASSKYAFGLGDLDFSNLYNGQYYIRASNAFEVMYAGGYTDSFRADHITYDNRGTPISGTVTEWTSGVGIGTDDSLRVTGLSIPITSIISAAQTASTDDDIRLIINALRGDDAIHGNQYNDALEGFDGNDMLFGHGGNDFLDGGNGVDDAYFSGPISAYSSGGSGDILTISGPDGTDQLVSIERLQFSNGTITLTDNDPLFDTVFYYQQNSDVFSAGQNALQHYRQTGKNEGRDPNALFDSAAYLAVNPDVKNARIDALEHYRHHGAAEGRDTSLDFDARLYLLHNPDVAKAGIDPLAHFLMFGKAEGRTNYMVVGESVAADGFDDDFYLFSNADVVASGMNAREHYARYGAKEGRDPNAYFEAKSYLQENPDVAAAGLDPLTHYNLYGYKEGRDPSAYFDTSYYLSANPDVEAAGINPLTHYLTNGLYEGRSGIRVDDLDL